MVDASAHSKDRILAGAPRSLTLLALSLLLSGCFAGYQVGNHTLFPSHVRTISVQMFANNSFRRGLGERLTEAVAKEVERRTPYKIVSSVEADAVLSGEIVGVTKRAIVENRFDDVRDSEMAYFVKLNWTGHGEQVWAEPRTVPIHPSLFTMNQATHIVPEVGQSTETAQQQAIVRLARQIVDQLEQQW